MSRNDTKVRISRDGTGRVTIGHTTIGFVIKDKTGWAGVDQSGLVVTRNWRRRADAVESLLALKSDLVDKATKGGAR